MRIGIYGGAFNPPHVGHIRAAEYARQALGLTKLLLIPSFISPHKPQPQGSATPEQRFKMLQIATEEKDITVSDMELRRGGTSYTWMTLTELRAEYPDAELVLLMGTDMFLSFHTWREPEKILQTASLGVFYRGEPEEQEKIREKKAELEAAGAKVYLVENSVTEISSTQLRRMLVFGCADPFLPEGVSDYIRSNGLYGTKKSYRGLSEKELEETVVELLKANRVNHILGCRDTARDLAARWGADENLAARAGLLHDITKALDGPLQLTLCREYGIVLDEFFQNNPKTLHALTGSLVAERIFGERPEVVAAIASHTTGKAHMNTLEKIIYVADYMEPNRDFPGVEELRELAYKDLDAALERGLSMTLDILQKQGRSISPQSEQALAWLRKKG